MRFNKNMAEYSPRYSPKKENIHMAVDDDEFSCPLCCELFEEPKLLPNCAHNFCKSCLREMVIRSNRNRISCPVCRKPSNVPRNGAEGFPTNTLLVRLIDNIPGRKEQTELEEALVRCKEKIERKKKIYKDIEDKCLKIKRNGELAKELKNTISTHAKEHIDSIKRYEQELCNEIDVFSIQNCGSIFEERLEKIKTKLQKDLEETSGVVAAVEKTLKKGDKMEILEKKDVMAEQLDEYSNVPTTSILDEIGTVKEFDMEFNKSKIYMENGLGKLETASGKRDRHAEEAFTGRTLNVGYVRVKPTPVSSPVNVSKPSRDDVYYKGTVVRHVPLEFQPFSVAVSPHSGQIALLYEERRQVHIFNASGSHLNTIYIKYGDLWDVAFSIDDEVIVVNRIHNRLLFYEKNGQFINREVEVPRSSLKFTYLSVDQMGRLIVTSKANDDDDDDDTVNCIIVYQLDEEGSERMFGRRYLKNPASRAIFFKGKYYVADRHSNEIFLQTFTAQGEAANKISLKPSAQVHSDMSLSRDPFSDKLIICCCNNSPNDFVKIVEVFVNHGTTPTKKLSCLHGFPKQVAAQSESFFQTRSRGTFQVEIYRDKNYFTIVKYPV